MFTTLLCTSDLTIHRPELQIWYSSHLDALRAVDASLCGLALVGYDGRLYTDIEQADGTVDQAAS